MKTKLFNLICIMLILSSILAVSVKAQVENSTLEAEFTVVPYLNCGIQTRDEIDDSIFGKEFYIKNLYTGQYLDVAGGVGANGTNVQQYKFNGSDAQKWYIKDNGNSTISIYSRLSNDNYYRYAIDISDGSTANGANVKIWSITDTPAQRFQLARVNEYDAFIFYTQVTNYEKAIVLSGPTCNQGENIEQYTF